MVVQMNILPIVWIHIYIFDNITKKQIVFHANIGQTYSLEHFI